MTKARLACWIGIGLTCVAVGCRGTPQGAGSASAEAPAASRREPRGGRANERPAPGQAPDTLPQWLFAPDNIWENRPGLSGRYVKNALSVLFMPGATVDERSAAISSVHGRVVGGFPQETGEGLYYITLPPDSTTETMLRALDRLNRLPQVAGATVVFAESADEQLDERVSDDRSGRRRPSSRSRDSARP